MTPQISGMTSSSFFWYCFISLVKVSYWSNFYVSIITGSGVMTISFYKGLTRNSEIGNTPVWVMLNIWILGQVKNTKYGTDVSNKMLLNDAKCQGYSFYHFWVIKRKPTRGGGSKISPLPPRLGLSSIYGVTVMRAISDQALCLLSWHILTNLLISRGTTMSITKQRVLWIMLAVHCVQVSKYAVISGRYSVWMRENTDQK